jgi:hypothetical protein
MQVELKADGRQLAYCQRDAQCACIYHIPAAQRNADGGTLLQTLSRYLDIVLAHLETFV